MKKDSNERLARWLNFLVEYDSEFLHSIRESNRTADVLSTVRVFEQDKGKIDVGNLVQVTSTEDGG